MLCLSSQLIAFIHSGVELCCNLHVLCITDRRLTLSTGNGLDRLISDILGKFGKRTPVLQLGL